MVVVFRDDPSLDATLQCIAQEMAFEVHAFVFRGDEIFDGAGRNSSGVFSGFNRIHCHGDVRGLLRRSSSGFFGGLAGHDEDWGELLSSSNLQECVGK